MRELDVGPLREPLVVLQTRPVLGDAGGVGVVLLPIIEPGVQPIEAVPSMAGRWAVVLKAVTAGGATARGTLIVRMPDPR